MNPILLYTANAVGIIAVILFLFSYQLKKRKGIVICNIASRLFYILQYILLFAFEGAVLDITAAAASVLADKKDSEFIKKHLKAVIIATNICIIGIGLLLYKNIFSLLPIIGVIFETGALWLTKEKHIRIVSLFGAPFWFVYNIVNSAYGSAVGNILTIVSLIIAILRYDIFKKEPKGKA